MKNIVYTLFFTCYLLGIISCQKEPEHIPVASLELNKSSISIVQGQTYTLTATIFPSNATNQNILWESSDLSVSTISDGIILAKKPGNAIITATSEDGGKSAICNVVVTNPKIDVTGVTIDKNELLLEEQEYFILTATVLPAEASNKVISWKTSDPGIVTVDNSGKVVAISKGTATVTVTTEDGGFSASCSVTVKSKVIRVTGISLNQTEIELVEGDIFTLIPNITPENATNKDVRWSSSNIGCASVDYDGNVTAVSEGLSIISAITEDGEKTATCSVKVKPKEIKVTGIVLDITELELPIGGTYTFIPSIKPENASNKNIIWSSSNTKIAIVNSENSVIALSEGIAIISATTEDGNYSASCTLKVNKYNTESIDLGLSVKWCSCNIGANSPEQYGDYYAWGEIEPYYEEQYALEDPQLHWKPGSSNKGYDWSNYKFCNGKDPDPLVHEGGVLTKYNYDSSYGEVDNKIQLEKDDDIAFIRYGEGFHIPTEYEWHELYENCTWTWTELNGIQGYKVTSNKEGYKDKWIFLPGSGKRVYNNLYSNGLSGYYWTSTLFSNLPDMARSFELGRYDGNHLDRSARIDGYTIRPVQDKRD